MSRSKIIQSLTLAAALGLSASIARAGPEDQFTKYPVGVGIAGVIVGGIADGGGTTTVSFEDAKRLGILDANGDPADFPPDGTQNLGGTGGGSVACHIFRNVWIEVQPRKADGTPNGPVRTIKVTLFVPKKPSEQTGADDAEKARKSGSVATKVGANICGAIIEGHKLEISDDPTNDPTKNKRSTGWRRVDGGGGGGGTGGTSGADKSAGVTEDDHYEDDLPVEPRLGQAAINSIPIELVQLNLAPITCFGQAAAQDLGVQVLGPETLEFQNHQILFMAGLTDILPDENNLLVLPMGVCQVQVPTIEGGVIGLRPVRAFILPDGDPFTVALGGNALVPPTTSMWLDGETHRLVWDFDGRCRADFNGDGLVNTLDVLAFLNAWSNGSQSADVNGDGIINTLDFLFFLNTWNAGCD